jgi:VWFA-related protein
MNKARAFAPFNGLREKVQCNEEIMSRTLLVGIFLLVAILGKGQPAYAQNAPASNADSGAASAKTPEPIRSTTRLVQVSIVVTDKKGEPVTGLKKEDFTLLDESKPQEIAFFNAETPTPLGGTPPALPPNVFTNRFDLKGQDPGAVTVVLFDSLNTAVQDQAYVRKQVIKFLQNLKPQDHVAVYGLTMQLLLLHEFTQDASALVAAAESFKPKEQGIYNGSNPDYFNVPAMIDAHSGWQQFQDAVNQTDARIADQYKLRRAEMTANALEAIANHVATIPGRKNLVWVSGSFPMSNILESLSAAVDRTNDTAGPYAAAAAQALNRVNMAIYPVDASGVVTSAGMDPSRKGDSLTDPNAIQYCADCVSKAPGNSPGMFDRQNMRDSERMLADATGGLAFYGSNDITVAMKRAFDDGRYAYTLGFYPNHGKWDGRLRKIKVQTKMAGAQLRYRNGYVADQDHTDSETQAKADLQQAAMSPLDATRLGMIVSTKFVGAAEQRKLELHVGLDPKQLRLQNAEQHEKGAVDLYFVQRNAQGETVSAESQRIGLNLEEKQYEYMSKAGLVLARHVAIVPEATDLRVLVRDAGSQALGSVTVPVKSLLAGEQVAPAKMDIPK